MNAYQPNDDLAKHNTANTALPVAAAIIGEGQDRRLKAACPECLRVHVEWSPTLRPCACGLWLDIKKPDGN